eukprot:11189511-Alexandrium_andersonii.AAC.1
MDDLAVVVSDVWRMGPQILLVLRRWASASGLRLNVSKCVLVPLWAPCREDVLRRALRSDLLAAAAFRIDGHAKYLGFHVGPGTGPSVRNAAIS